MSVLELLKNYGEFLFPVIAIIGMVWIQLFNKEEKNLFRISWDKLAMFMAFLFALAIFRLMQFDYLLSHGLMKMPHLPEELRYHKYALGLVFWEDFFFAVPIYFIMKNCKRNWLKYSSIAIISLLFGLGHAYQGWSGIAITMFLPYFVSYRYGKEYGFGTVMVGHVMYDITTAYLIVLLPYLL